VGILRMVGLYCLCLLKRRRGWRLRKFCGSQKLAARRSTPAITKADYKL
jgi:hypothetical protein